MSSEMKITDVLDLLSPTELAYMAGIIDGEGSLNCQSHAKGKTFYPICSISMTDEKVIRWLGNKWGVTVTYMSRRKDGYRPQFMVRLNGKRVMRLCFLVAPYLIVKRAQAELIITFPIEGRVGPGSKISGTDLNNARAALRDQINGFNLRPRNAAYRRGSDALMTRAGRLLDGRTHDGMPEVAAAAQETEPSHGI